MEGNLVVDKVLASCYASANHDLADIPVLPIKYFPWIMEWIFGEDSGFSTYSKIAISLNEWMVPSDNSMNINCLTTQKNTGSMR